MIVRDGIPVGNFDISICGSESPERNPRGRRHLWCLRHLAGRPKSEDFYNKVLYKFAKGVRTKKAKEI